AASGEACRGRRGAARSARSWRQGGGFFPRPAGAGGGFSPRLFPGGGGAPPPAAPSDRAAGADKPAECPWYQKKPPALPTRRFILPARLANSSHPPAAFFWSPGAWLAEGGQGCQLFPSRGGAAGGC